MPKFDLETIFGEIAGFLTFDIGNLFSINPTLKCPLFLPKCWDGHEHFLSSSTDELENYVKPMRVCSVTAKIKREERKRNFKIRKSGYEVPCEELHSCDSNSEEQHTRTVGTNFGSTLSQPCIRHGVSGCCDSKCRAISEQHVPRDWDMRQNETQLREASLANRIRKCIEEKQLKLMKKANNWGRKRNDCREDTPTRHYEQLRKNHSSDVERCNPVVVQPPEKTNFFENLQDAYNKNHRRIKCPIEIAECGIQVYPEKTHKLVGTDSQTKCTHRLKWKNAIDKKPAKGKLSAGAVVLPQPKTGEENITAFLRRCIAEEKKLKRAKQHEGLFSNDNQTRTSTQKLDHLHKMAKQRRELVKRIKRRESVPYMQAAVDIKQGGQRQRQRNSNEQYDQDEERQQQTAIGNRMIAVLHDKLNKADIAKRRDVIEQRARQVWQLFQLSTPRGKSDGDNRAMASWKQLKPYQKLAFSWAVIANKNVFDNPLDNFMDFYINECTAGGKRQVTAAIVEQGLELWDRMSKNERLPFVMEAFIFLLSMGEVDMNNETEIERVLNELQ